MKNNSNYLLYNKEEDLNNLRLFFGGFFHFITYIVIGESWNDKDESKISDIKYLQAIIQQCYESSYQIIFVTVSTD